MRNARSACRMSSLRALLESFNIFFNDTATTEIYTLSLHDALPIYKRLREGSGGDGQYRGGLGQDVAIDIESEDDIAALFVVERTKIAAPGLGGGTAGGLGFVTINGKTIDNRRPQFVRGGDRIVLGTPGGGGFGSANLRSTADRERDREMGYVEP